MDSTVLKKKKLILTFQNWRIETHGRSLVEVRWRRGRGQISGHHSFKEEEVDTYFPELVDRNSWYVPRGGWVEEGEGPDQWTAQF